MAEREPQHETINRGELFFLECPLEESPVSGYGLTINHNRKDQLVGVVRVDHPEPIDPSLLQSIRETFGECNLVPMITTGERGLLCTMHIDSYSQSHIRQIPGRPNDEIRTALRPLLDNHPAPKLRVWWDAKDYAWKGDYSCEDILPVGVKEVFEQIGYGCLAAETDFGIIHVCHASDEDLDGFRNKPAYCIWQLIEMPTAPLIRLLLVVMDNPVNPFQFESFLNVADRDQANILSELANQDRLYLSFYGDSLAHQYTTVTPHTKHHWQDLDKIVEKAHMHRQSIPEKLRDFNKAKFVYMTLSG